MANQSIAPFANASDGIIRNTGTVWATVRSAGTGTLVSAAGTYNGLALAGFSTPTYTLDRGFFSFDLSSIPAGAEILSATLSVKYNGTKAGTGEIGIVSGSPASPTSYATSDFGSVGSTELASRKNLTAFASSGTYYDYALNSSGLAYLQGRIGSYATLVGRSAYDLDNSAPGSGNHYAYVYYSEQSGTSDDPYLTVTYSTARTTADSWAWSDSALNGGIDEADGDRLRETWDTWAWSDSAAPYRRAVAEVEVWAAGANTLLNGAHSPAGATITVDSTTSFGSTGTVWLIDGYTQAYATYTGKTATTFTGCSWTSVIGDLSFPDNCGVTAPDAETHFPQVTALDDPAATSIPELIISATQHSGHAGLNGSLVLKRSTNGGVTWGSQETFQSAVTSGFGIFGHTMARMKNGRLIVMWYEHDLSYVTADSIAAVETYLSYSDDRGDTWSTPALMDFNMGYSNRDGICGFASTLYTGAGTNATYGDLYVPIYGNKDGIQVHSTGQTYRWESWLYKITDGGSGGTATKVAEVFKYSDVALAAGEPDLVIAENGDWVMQARVEADSTAYSASDRDRWQSVSTDQGATWSTPTMVIHAIANGAALEKLPGGTLISTGSPVLYGDVNAGQTGTFLSHDNGTTWSTSPRTIKWEATNGTYDVYNGADTEVIVDDPGVKVNTAFAYSQEIGSTQTGARTMFRWYVDPVSRASDAWAWSDTATQTTTVVKTTSDTWAWSDSADGGNRSTGDTWAWADVATGAFSQGRSTSDTWAWSDAAAGTLAVDLSRTTSDTWAWSDTAADTYVGPHYYSRTTSDIWAWSESTGALGMALYWLRAARRRSMSATTKTYTVVQAKGTARTATWTSPTYESKTEAGILVSLDVTAASGTGGLTLRINAHDLAGSTVVPLNTAPTAVTAIGTTSYALYPFGAISGAVTQSTSGYLPRQFSITVTAGDSSSYTYSVGYCLLP